MIGKLRRRIIAINVVSMGLVLLLAIVFLFTVDYRRLNDEKENRLRFALEFKPSENEPFDQNKLFNDIALACYDTEQNEMIARYYGKEFAQDDKRLEELVSQAVASRRSGGLLHANITFLKQTDGSTVKVAINITTGNKANMYAYLGITLGVLMAGLACYCVISFLLARTALRPVEESWKKQKQFVADASHELKTPLSVIMANTDMIAAHKEETVESQMKWIENTQSEAKRMADLVADLLFLAKNDDGLRVTFDEVNLSDCVSSVVLGYDVIFYENKKTFSEEIQPDLHVEGNLGQLKQFVSILLDNANRYSVESGNIKLKLTAVGKHAQFTLSNDCVQFTQEQLSHLFDRFYTVDPSRNKNHGGNGLGLAIAETICKTHKGSLHVACADGRITFTANFPLKKRA